jgi:hypothetical protein
MSRGYLRLCALMALVPINLLATTAFAMGPNLTYTEDFHTTNFKDPVGTTAVWNTSAGTVSLIPFAPTPLGHGTGGGTANGIAVSGDIACVATATGGLMIYDVSDVTGPALVATIPVAGTPRAVAIAGTVAYLACGTAGLILYDISHPGSPFQLGRLDTPEDSRGVTVVGTKAYVATISAGLLIVNVANPQLPVEVSRIATADRAMAVAVEGDIAYVADYRAGFCVINVANPASPFLLTRVDLATPGLAVAVSGDLLALAAGTSGAVLFDVTNPSAPSIRGSVSAAGSVNGVHFRNRVLMASSTGPGLFAWDVSNPATPVEKWNCSPSAAARGLTTAGTVAFVAVDNVGLQTIRIGETTDPPNLTGLSSSSNHERDGAVSGDVLCIVGDPVGLVTKSFPAVGTPPTLGTIATPGDAIAVAVEGNLVCVADSLAGLSTFSIANPSIPFSLSNYNTPGQAVDVALRGGIAYVADGTAGLAIINAGNPGGALLLGTRSLPGTANAVELSGNLACVTDGALRLVNVANPAAPILVGSYTSFGGGSARGVAVSGSIAWVTAGAAGLFAIDISNPSAPTLISNTPAINSYPYAKPQIHGANVLLLADWGSVSTQRLLRYDVTNPTAPVLTLIQVMSMTYTKNMFVADDYVVAMFAPPSPASGGIMCYRLAQAEVSGPVSGDAVSTNFVAEPTYIVCARLIVAQSGSIAWRLDYDGNFHQVPSTGTWFSVLNGNAGVRWKAQLDWLHANPVVSNLRIDWRLHEARIDSVADVRPDQGGWANLYFTASGHDVTSYGGVVTGYTVYRRVGDKTLAAQASAAKAARLPGATVDGVAYPTGREVLVDGKAYIVNDGADKSAPPGVWSILTSFWATKQDQYVVTVPTVADDGPDWPGWSSYYVSAYLAASSTFYASAPDSGRSIDNIAPGVPAGLLAQYTGSGAALQWAAAPERDFQYFRVYRGSSPDFTPTLANLVGAIATPAWTDVAPEPWANHYKVTTVDHAGNESAPASPAVTSGVEATPAPTAFALRANEPNPFNAGTTIRYDVPAGGGRVDLAIYDARGSLVRRLLGGEEPAGRRQLRWDGRDDNGRTLATGVYFCRMSTPAGVHTRKMSLVQ